jgi:hypothetical protein
MKCKYWLIALSLVSSACAAAGSESCPTPDKAWKDKFEKNVLEQAPSMFDKCSPFSGLFNSDFFGDLLNGILGNKDLFCGYGTDDLFGDVTDSSSRPSTIVKDAANGVTNAVTDTVNKSVKPYTNTDKTVGSSQNDVLKNIIFDK